VSDRRTRTPAHRPVRAAAAPDQAWTLTEIRALGVTTDLITAGRILGVSRNSAYRLARRDAFPVPVIRVGTQYRVPVGGLLALLHPGEQTLCDAPPGRSVPVNRDPLGGPAATPAT
jgi:hypothetical protein